MHINSKSILSIIYKILKWGVGLLLILSLATSIKIFVLDTYLVRRSHADHHHARRLCHGKQTVIWPALAAESNDYIMVQFTGAE